MHFGGGLGLRGFAGYYAPEKKNGESYLLYKGTSGAAINLEFEFDRFLGFHNWRFMNRHGLEWHTYLFTDAGVIAQQIDDEWIIGTPKVDVGAGLSLTLNKLFMFENFKPITFRGDFPMFVSEKAIRSDDWFIPKWVVGIGRAF